MKWFFAQTCCGALLRTLHCYSMKRPSRKTFWFQDDVRLHGRMEREKAADFAIVPDIERSRRCDASDRMNGLAGHSLRQRGLAGSTSSNWTGAIPKRPMTAGSFAAFLTPS